MEAINNIVVYSTHCPKCKDLEEKLRTKGLLFTVVDQQDKVMELAKIHNLNMVPFVVVSVEMSEGKVLTYEEALKYFNL